MHQTERNPKSEADVAVAALKNISAEDRLIASLYFFEQLTIGEINQVLGMDAVSIRKCLDNVFAALIPEESDIAAETENRAVSTHYQG